MKLKHIFSIIASTLITLSCCSAATFAQEPPLGNPNEIPVTTPLNIEHTHNYLDVLTIDPYMGKDGEITWQCTICFDKYTEVIPAPKGPHEHKYSWYTESQSTCTTPGVVVYDCVICGDHYTKELPLDEEHNFVLPSGDGYVCTYCGTYNDSYWHGRDYYEIPEPEVDQAERDRIFDYLTNGEDIPTISYIFDGEQVIEVSPGTPKSEEAKRISEEWKASIGTDTNSNDTNDTVESAGSTISTESSNPTISNNSTTVSEPIKMLSSATELADTSEVANVSVESAGSTELADISELADVSGLADIFEVANVSYNESESNATAESYKYNASSDSTSVEVNEAALDNSEPVSNDGAISDNTLVAENTESTKEESTISDTTPVTENTEPIREEATVSDNAPVTENTEPTLEGVTSAVDESTKIESTINSDNTSDATTAGNPYTGVEENYLPLITLAAVMVVIC